MVSYNEVPIKEMQEHKIKFKGYGMRHTQAILIFCCLVTTSIVRTCISVALLAMTDSNRTMHSNESQIFDWDKPTQGIVMSSFHWGDFVMQIPAGYLVCKFGPRIFLTLATLVSGLCAFSTPIASQYAGWQGACASRIVLGMFNSFIFPSIHTLLGKWAPMSERNRFGIIVYSGYNIASVIGNPISAYIGASSYGWPWIFYTYGIVCLFNAAIFGWIGANSPAEHKSISKVEREFIESSLGEENHEGNKKVPWKAMMKSKPVYALIIAQCCIYSAYTAIAFEIPTFFKIGLNIDLESSGVLASLPYIASVVGGILCSFCADYLLNKEIFSLTVIRKLFNSLGCLIPSACFIGLVYLPPDNKALAISLVVIIIGADAITGAGIMLNHIDLSPNFAAILVSWSLTISDVSCLLAPIASGNIVSDPTDMGRWKILFLLTGATYALGNIVFVLFASAEKQPWDDVQDSPNIVFVPSDLDQELQYLRSNNNEKTKERELLEKV